MPGVKPTPRQGTILLPPRFLGTVDYYAAMMAYSHGIIDTEMAFNKRQKSPHRAAILDANGDAMITVPIEKPSSMSRALWSDITVSGHGGWWNVAVTALRSAYGRTPFFEYYIDEFLPLLSESAVGRRLMDLDCDLDRLLRRLLGIETEISYGSPTPEKLISGSTADYRTRRPDFIHEKEYYQLRASRHGFQGHLSVVDLLFNLGPEAPMVLAEMI